MLVRNHDRKYPVTEQGVLQALRELGEPGVRMLLQVKRADNLAQAPAYRGNQQMIDAAEEILNRVLAQGRCYRLRQLAVRGEDLAALGLKGRDIGAALEWLLDRVIAGDAENESGALLALLRGKLCESAKGSTKACEFQISAANNSYYFHY